MELEGKLDIWFDGRLKAGQNFKKEIASKIADAQLVLVLVSENLLASEYSYQEELRRSFARSDEQHARIVPILIRDCDWRQSWFGQLEALPSKAVPLEEWEDEQSGLNDVAARLAEVLEELAEDQPYIDEKLIIFDDDDLIEILQNIRRALAVLNKAAARYPTKTATQLIEIDELEQREKKYVDELKRRGVLT